MESKKFVNPTKSNMTLSIIIPQIRQLLKESPDSILAAVNRQGAQTAADAFTSAEMQAHMAKRLSEHEAESDEKLANDLRVKINYILDNPSNPNVLRAINAAGGNLKDFLLQLTTRIVELARAS